MKVQKRLEKGNLKWDVWCEDTSTWEISRENILAYKTDLIKGLKKKSKDRAEFSELMRREMMYRYWSKCEWEVLVTKTPDGRVMLLPWIGYGRKKDVDVTDEKDFDWVGFADKMISAQNSKNEAKIDVFDQLQYRWEEFIDYCWYTRLKYERDDPKFHKKEELHEDMG